MKCAWSEFLQLVPHRMRSQVDSIGKITLQELRLRIGQVPELVCKDRIYMLTGIVNSADLQYTINAASQYSPWAAATIVQGYLTGPGGHRIGICGTTVVKSGAITGFSFPTSICIRVARDFPGIAQSISPEGSVLIIGSPGSGKTTFLRDLIRNRSERGCGPVTVIDERCELFPQVSGKTCFETGCRTDILTGCSKEQGIPMALRTMGPSCIAVDEITAESDTQALLHAAWCGVDLFATAHAGSKNDLFSRPTYQPILAGKLFQTLLILKADKSWTQERLGA